MMRDPIHQALEQYRIQIENFESERGDLHGAFLIVNPHGAYALKVISSGKLDRRWGRNWEHVSVSTNDERHTLPTWTEMCFVKDLFWSEDDCVVQYHPPRADYVNHHPGCLHLWRPRSGSLPRPPSFLVGPKT